EYALVCIEECDRRELKPRHAGDGSQHAGHAPLFAGGCRGDPKHAEAPGWGKQAVALLERVAAHRVKNQLYPPPFGDLARTRFEILRTVVDQVVHTQA